MRLQVQAFQVTDEQSAYFLIGMYVVGALVTIIGAAVLYSVMREGQPQAQGSLALGSERRAYAFAVACALIGAVLLAQGYKVLGLIWMPPGGCFWPFC